MLYPETLYQALGTHVVNRDHFSVSKWLTSSRQGRDISFLLIWFPTAKLLIVCDFGYQSFSACKKAEVPQRGPFTAAVYLVEKYWILCSWFHLYQLFQLDEGQSRVWSKFYLFRQNIGPNSVASRMMVQEEGPGMTVYRYDSCINSAETYWVPTMCWGPVQGTGNSTMNKTRSLPSRNLQTHRKNINRWIQQGIGTVTRRKSRLPRAVNWVLLVQGTGKSLPQVMEERGLWGGGGEARESRVKCWKQRKKDFENSII